MKSKISRNLRSITESVGDAIIPKKYRKEITIYFQKCGIDKVPYFSFGITVYIIFFLSVAVDFFLLNLSIFSNFPIFLNIIFSLIFVPVFFVAFLFFVSIVYKTSLDAKISYKVQKMEEVFPEFLSELSLNLKAGQSLEEALENSLEKEFGYLKYEIETVCKKTSLGADVETALKEFTNNFDSDMIEESFNLIILSWKKGAKTPPLIDRIVSNIRETRFLRQKVIASVGSYRIFIAIVTILIAPAMFAMAFYLIGLIRSIINKILESSSSLSLPFVLNVIRVNDSHFMLFSQLSVAAMAVSCAFIISVVKGGTLREGYKEMFLYLVSSLVSFRIFLLLFGVFFSFFKI